MPELFGAFEFPPRLATILGSIQRAAVPAPQDSIRRARCKPQTLSQRSRLAIGRITFQIHLKEFMKSLAKASTFESLIATLKSAEIIGEWAVEPNVLSP